MLNAENARQAEANALLRTREGSSMKRYFFFAILFPPAFMNTLLTVARPPDLLHYFLAGYFVAMVPALLIALLDGVLERKPAAVRAGFCALIALMSMPVMFFAFNAASAWQAAQLSLCAAVTGFICTMAFVQLSNRFPVLREQV
jgi:hypothetical protein